MEEKQKQFTEGVEDPEVEKNRTGAKERLL